MAFLDVARRTDPADLADGNAPGEPKVSRLLRGPSSKVYFSLGQLNQACWTILKSLRSASPFAALSVQSTSTEHPFLVVCGPCCLPALT